MQRPVTYLSRHSVTSSNRNDVIMLLHRTSQILLCLYTNIYIYIQIVSQRKQLYNRKQKIAFKSFSQSERTVVRRGTLSQDPETSTNQS